MVLLCCTGWVLWLVWWTRRTLAIELEHFPETFRPSDRVTADWENWTTEPSLAAVLNGHPELCGVAAAQLRVYQRVAVIRDVVPGPLYHVFDMAWVPAPNSTSAIHTDSSPVCNGESWTDALLYDSVFVVADVLGPHQQAFRDGFEVHGKPAHCIQRLCALMDGEWPCQHSLDPLDAMLIPRLLTK